MHCECCVLIKGKKKKVVLYIVIYLLVSMLELETPKNNNISFGDAS